jgi:cbb3-type cytochrome oxidase maturation protein
MEVLFILLPVAVALAAVAVGVFIWAARSGQFDDLETPGIRMLHDDEPGPRRGRHRDDHTT